MLHRSSSTCTARSAPWLVADLDLIIPVYRNKPLVEQCLDSLLENIDEIAEHSPRLIVVNDSPDDEEVTQYLRDQASIGRITVLIENSKNLGFVKSTNRALDDTRKRQASAILINSDTLTFPGTLKELVAVADLDDQTAFVCPRSNNASICSFPAPPHGRAGTTLSASECYRAWQDLRDFLPRVSYAPTAVGFYMLIKSVVIRNFDGLDEKFGVGYEEENDLVLRAGKVGFRPVIANHSFAYHAGSASFTLLDLALEDHRQANFSRNQQMHPEFLPLVQAYESSPEVRAERLLKGLLPNDNGKVSIAFNLLAIGDHFNGTNEFIGNVIRSFIKIASNQFEVTLLCYDYVAKFHGFDKLGVRITTYSGEKHAVALKFGQPYDLHSVNIMEDIAPVNVYCMLDAISLDCGPLRHSQNITKLWSYVAETANGCVFISDFSYKTFFGRFPHADVRAYAALLPTQVECYTERYQDAITGSSHVFVAGNHFDHKDSSRTGRKLAVSFPTLGFIVMGATGVFPPNVRQLNSGSVSDNEMIAVMAKSSVIVLPSYYEGFGFTFMHALALKKPIVARDIPATREILETFGATDGIYLFGDDDDLLEAMHTAIGGPPSAVRDSRGLNWLDWSLGLERFIADLLSDRTRLYPKLVARVRHGDMLRQEQERNQERSGEVNSGGKVGGSLSQQVNLDWTKLTALSDGDFTQFVYREVLGREPDAEGLRHYLHVLRQGAPRREVVQSFLTSAEFLASGRTVHINGLPAGGSQRARRWRLFRRQ